jgi:hypothetical protein
MARLLLFIAILLATFIGLELLAGALFIYSLLRYTGLELIAVGVLLDGYTGAFFGVPYLTIGSFLLWLIVDTVRHGLLLYTTKNEVIS